MSLQAHFATFNRFCIIFGILKSAFTYNHIFFVFQNRFFAILWRFIEWNWILTSSSRLQFIDSWHHLTSKGKDDRTKNIKTIWAIKFLANGVLQIRRKKAVVNLKFKNYCSCLFFGPKSFNICWIFLRWDGDGQDRDGQGPCEGRGQAVRGVQLLRGLPVQRLRKVPQGTGIVRRMVLLRRVPSDRRSGKGPSVITTRQF